MMFHIRFAIGVTLLWMFTRVFPDKELVRIIVDASIGPCGSA